MTDPQATTRKFQKELNAGTASLVLLSVLGNSQQPLYGYQIAKMLEAHGTENPMMKQGSMYPVLRSLEENGLLSSMVEPSVSGPPRRYYQITELGNQALSDWAAIWSATKTFVDSILKG